MRLTLVLFLATVFAAASGVYAVNAKVGGVEDEAVTEPAQAARVKLPADPAPTSAPPPPTIVVSGCFESDRKCRCIDSRGHRIPLSQLSDDDCRVMLKIGPK